MLLYENSYGVKLCSSMRETIIDKILKLYETNENDSKKKYEDSLLFIIGKNIGFNKFKSIDDIVKNKSKMERILKNESAFNGNLGLSLMQFFDLWPNKTLIYEDTNGSGRTIKERTENGERILSFIPTFGPENSHYTVDDDIKDYNELAEKNYDIIEGRYYEN